MNGATLEAVFLVVLLVVLLGDVEGRRHGDFGSDALAGMRGFERLEAPAGGGFLLGALEEDRRAILGADVVSLPIRAVRVGSRWMPG